MNDEDEMLKNLDLLLNLEMVESFEDEEDMDVIGDLTQADEDE